ncbi:hypothetical protein Pcinc_023696 [Petrolisthes cinctipes]|uniref:Uncharacterized protein n=1 Tax=Petrolisthes cinctipes TaxID=88211 RepID=A0AAE1KE38_PETCI|nr:hypothetical protein Pcinc_023696 [Petrolisthes cinctipes]
MQPLDQELIATVKQFYCQQVYSYLRSSTETKVELATMEEMVMSDSETEDNSDTPPPSANQHEDNNNTTLPPSPPPVEMSVMIFWHQSTVKNTDDFLLTARDKDSEATVNQAWHLLVPNLCAPPPETAIQPLAESSTLATAQQVPGLQELTLQEVQEAPSSIEQQDPFEILEHVKRLTQHYNPKNCNNNHNCKLWRLSYP